MTQQFDSDAIKAFGTFQAPIPGQSLTNDPDDPYPWESPPQYTDFQEALDYTVAELLEEDAYSKLMEGIGSGVPIADVVSQILYTGFTNGKWNPDMMLMLAEPLMYVIMALTEKSGIEYRLYDNEEDDELSLDDKIETNKQGLDRLEEVIESKVGKKPSPSAIPKETLEKIEEAEVPSLLAPTEEPVEEPVEENNNLLDRQE